MLIGRWIGDIDLDGHVAFLDILGLWTSIGSKVHMLSQVANQVALTLELGVAEAAGKRVEGSGIAIWWRLNLRANFGRGAS